MIWRRCGAVLVGLLASTFVVVPAFADVTVVPTVAAAGSTIDVSLTVKNERAEANTTAIEIDLSGQQSVPSADTPRHPGWSSSVEIAEGRVQRIVWERGLLRPGESDSFIVTIKVPTTGDRLILKTVQTYSNGEVVHHTGPSLMITGGAPTIPATSTLTAPAKAVNESDKDSSGLSGGKVLILVGIVTVMAVYARAKRKSRRG